MFLFAAVLLAALSATGAVANDYNPLLSGFRDASIVHSSGGKAVCAAGNVWVNITTTNIKLLFEAPSNQTVVTETLQELLQANPTIYARTNGGNNTFSARYRIYARLCYPTSVPDRKQVKTVQLLTHGLTLDHGYWDIPGFSYVDAAAEAGYATLSYDRLGIGQSEHPDPVQVVQLAPQFEIAHGLAQLLRAGALGGHAFGSVVGAGHSLGSVVTAGVTAKYPRDFDAAIITGLTVNGTYGLVISAALDFHIANQQNPRFGGLANGYLTPPLQSGVQFAFWRWPYFEQSGSLPLTFIYYTFFLTVQSSTRSSQGPRPLLGASSSRSLRLSGSPQTSRLRSTWCWRATTCLFAVPTAHTPRISGPRPWRRCTPTPPRLRRVC